MELLGAPIGVHNNSFTRDFVQSTVNKHNKWFQLVGSSLMPIQSAMLLFRWCGLPRLSYLSRLLPPYTVQAEYKLFDDMCDSAVIRKLKLPLPLPPARLN